MMQAYSHTIAKHPTPWGVTLLEYGEGRKHHEPPMAVIHRAPHVAAPRKAGDVLWQRTGKVNGVAAVRGWRGSREIRTHVNHWELSRVYVSRPGKLKCEAVCRGPHCEGSKRDFDASDWSAAENRTRQWNWCTVCRAENKAANARGPRMVPALPLMKERGWTTGTVLVSKKWKSARQIKEVLEYTIRLSDGRGGQWCKRLPVDAHELTN